MTDTHPDRREEGSQFRVAFGVGSWKFGLKVGRGFRSSIADYCSLLTDELESISSLSDLIIDHDEDELMVFVEDSDSTVFLDHSIFLVQFNLYIPFRVQREIVGHCCVSETGTEKFRIHIRFGYDAPVGFVELIEDVNARSPSTAVRIVREYIQNQIDKMPSNLVFEFVGPSPFHADFWIEGYRTPNSSTGDFECTQSRGLGYAKITFRCCVDHIASKEEACETLFSELDSELDVFYNIVRCNLSDYRGWAEIDEAVSKLFEHLEETAGNKSIWKLFARGRELSALRMALSKFEADHIQRRHYAERQCRELYGRQITGFLQRIVEGELERRPIFPMKQTRELVMFVETRRSKAIELAIILLAAVIGGVAGSMITVLLSSGS